MLKFSPILRTRRGAQIHPFGWFTENRQLVPWTAVLITLVCAIPCSAQYAASVQVDEPFAYWLLDEVEGTTDLTNIGTEVEPASYSGPLTLGEPGLADPNRNAVRFAGVVDGVQSEINIADSARSNAGGPYDAKTIELWFSAEDASTATEQVLFEQGGSTRGLAVYIRDGMVFMGGHNSAAQGPGSWAGGTGGERAGFFPSAPIESNTTYHVAMVMEGDSEGLDGTMKGYLNGELIGEEVGVGLLFAHTDDIAIGGVRAQTLFDNGLLGDDPATPNNFVGVIDDVALYNTALSADRVKAHFDSVEYTFGDFNGDDALDIADFLVMASNFNGPGVYADGDVNFDRTVGIDDFVEWRRAFQSQAGTGAAVPEPGTGVMLGLGLSGLGLALRTRRRRPS